MIEFLDGWAVWPTCDQFAAGGAKSPREAITHVHGAAWWAREMGVPGGDRPSGGVRRWTDDAIRDTLAGLLRGRSSWPTNREFDDAGLHAFREALRHYGGPGRWAAEMGVTYVPRSVLPTPSRPASQSHRPASRARRPTSSATWPRWTEASIAVALAEFLAGADTWPAFDEFVVSGRKGLYQAVLKHGGSEQWARRLGVRRISRKGGNRRWSEERVRLRLRAFLGDRREWPRSREFVRGGEAALLRAVRRFGGVERWAAEFRVTIPVDADRRSGLSAPEGSSRFWTDERIASSIAPLIAELGRWPTKGEFRRAGLGKALAAVYEHGGSAIWQARFGVAPRAPLVRVPDRRRWTPERVEAELRAFCATRAGWPSERGFRQAGRHDLYRAAGRYGGARYWRATLGYPGQGRPTAAIGELEPGGGGGRTRP